MSETFNESYLPPTGAIGLPLTSNNGGIFMIV